MTHDTASRRLGAYLDNEIPAEERALIQSHLAECPTCAATLHDLEFISQTLRQLPPASIEPEILARLHTGVDNLTRRPLERFVGLLSGVAACIAVLGGLMLLQPSPSALAAGPARWEGRAIGMIDENLATTTPNVAREAAIGEWVIANLSPGGADHE